MSKPNWNAVASALEKQKSKLLEQRIPGSFTSTEYAEQLGISVSRARVVLVSLVSIGSIKRVRVPISRADNSVSWVPGYVLVEKKRVKN